MAAAIPNARFQLIDGAGHLVQEDAYDELSSLIIGFLEVTRPRWTAEKSQLGAVNTPAEAMGRMIGTR